ncbi:hypothetical protein [Micromonospora sp. DT47]|uniref:hypothetical protein n=1 Tax=Micromonospora sp. DT47 TaxID=3393431 RepID=UPI003CF37A9A
MRDVANEAARLAERRLREWCDLGYADWLAMVDEKETRQWPSTSAIRRHPDRRR